MESKRELRARMLDEQKKLRPEYILQSDGDIFNRLVELPEYVSAKTVFVFCSVGNEVDTRRLIEKSLAEGKRVAIPITLGVGVMEFSIISSLSGLRAGRLDIPEPDKSSPRVRPGKNDVMIVPGLAFDVGGNRLGHGAGYYDRYLANCECPTVGLCREVFFHAHVPHGENDVSVDMVITEKGITRPPKEPRF